MSCRAGLTLWLSLDPETLASTVGAPSQSLFEPCLAPLLKAACYLTGNRDDAADLTQEAVLRAGSAFHTLGPAPTSRGRSLLR